MTSKHQRYQPGRHFLPKIQNYYWYDSKAVKVLVVKIERWTDHSIDKTFVKRFADPWNQLINKSGQLILCDDLHLTLHKVSSFSVGVLPILACRDSVRSMLIGRSTLNKTFCFSVSIFWSTSRSLPVDPVYFRLTFYIRIIIMNHYFH